MTDELAPYLNFTLPSATGPREIQLRLPRMRDIAGLLHEQGVDRDERRLAIWLPSIPLCFVERLDGTEFLYDRLDPFLADAELVRGLLLRIRTLIDTFRERGKVFVGCPGCMTWETEISFTAYALTIATPLPSSFDGPFFTIPTLGDRAMRGNPRPPLPRAAQIRFELPSACLGMARTVRGGVLGQLNFQENEDDVPPPPPDDDVEEVDEIDENAPPVWSGASWRAIVRLADAIEPHASVDDLSRLPLFDFFFLELLYFVTAIAPVNPDTAGKITCPTCGTVFLPVRPDWKAPR